ncbi:GNAT family N-acetyltransferase [Cognatiyoonia sp. IB215182]|uniref:GNAT family N-acetyltransferase n=1 Tax=Cognatiyoonia sp. IB215182 TaxID=3097353 RepID=UPI002A118CFC|nr:GNAT family N-acetyltransferase [Cognatiyoonia sp. IB215182]MDX8352597.1 GNAT family N-acetyltransferase [Cognatiyoonia sp. IB215182]
MTKSAFIYRTLSPGHAEAWRALRVEGARDYPMGFLVTLEETKAVDPARCRAILEAGATRGVFDGETLIGFCGYRPNGLERIRHRAEIGPFFVTAAYHGIGAADALMDGVIGEAREGGLAQIELFVDTENHRAIAFYEKHGFRREATHYDGVRIDGQSRDDHFYTLRL